MATDLRRQLVYVASLVIAGAVWWFLFEDLPPGWAVIALGVPLGCFWNAVMDDNETYRHMQEAETSSHEPAYGDARGEVEENE
jgi:hypothetical protein